MGNFNYKEYLQSGRLFAENLNEEEKVDEVEETNESEEINENDKLNLVREMVKAALMKEDDLNEAKEDEEEDVELEDEGDEDVDLEDVEGEDEIGGGDEAAIDDAEGMSGDKEGILNALKVAFDKAEAMGDEKLSDQIGNTITMFTRTHIVNRD